MKSKTAKNHEPELLFRALGDRTRLRLLNLMGDGEVCVCFLVEALRLSQPKISRHLAYLRRAGIVLARREGKWMHYRLGEPREAYLAVVLAAARAALKGNPSMQTDRSRLVRLCRSPARSTRLTRKPLQSRRQQSETVQRPFYGRER
jgi:ArsR family transcriptional regulator